MTRTEYTNALRKAGFAMQPAWQATTNGERLGKDVTCYRVSAADGSYLTHMIVQQIPEIDGIEVFFASPNLRAADDIDHLKRLAKETA